MNWKLRRTEARFILTFAVLVLLPISCNAKLVSPVPAAAPIQDTISASATGVFLELQTATGPVTLRSRTMEIRGNGSPLLFKGNVRVEVTTGNFGAKRGSRLSGLTLTGEQMTISPEVETLELEGDVVAVFSGGALL